MTLEELRDAVRVRLGVPAIDTFFQDPQLDDLVNEALQVFSLEEDWPWLQATETINTVAGTRFYTPLDPLWARTKALSIQGFDALSMLSLQEIRNWPDDIRDVPVYYTLYMEQLYLAPAPSAIYALRHDYYKFEPVLNTPTDIPIVPAIYHFAIIAYAVHLAHLRSGDLARASAARQEYDAWLKRVQDNRRDFSSPMKVRVRPGRDI